MLRVALLQVGSPATETVAARRERVGQMVAAAKGADLVVLPELWGPGYFAFDHYRERAEPTKGDTVTAGQEWARELGCYLHLGSFVECAPDGRLYNTAVLIDPAGEIAHTYEISAQRRQDPTTAGRSRRGATESAILSGSLTVACMGQSLKKSEVVGSVDRPEFSTPLAEARDREADNIVKCLNALTDLAFEPLGAVGEMTDVESTRAKRMSYQSALTYVATMIRELWGNVAMKPGGQKFMMADELTEAQWAKIHEGIQRLARHPAWTASYEEDESQRPKETSEALRQLKLSLEKNQEARRAFQDLALDLPYLLTGDLYPLFGRRWGGRHT